MKANNGFPSAAVVALAAGASIGIIADVILFPLDFLKTRQQGKISASTHGRSAVAREASAVTGSAAPSSLTSRSPLLTASPRDVLEARSRFEKSRGLTSCYRGIAALAMGSMPSSAGFFFVYEVAKERLKFLGRAKSSTYAVLGCSIRSGGHGGRRRNAVALASSPQTMSNEFMLRAAQSPAPPAQLSS
ncbi:hypothetical protein Emag_002418 [Eimeria magna]